MEQSLGEDRYDPQLGGLMEYGESQANSGRYEPDIECVFHVAHIALTRREP